MKAHLTAIDWPPRADDLAYLAHLERSRRAGDRKAMNPCHFAGTRGLDSMFEDALGHLYHGWASGLRGVFGDGTQQCGCGARKA